MIRIPVKLYSVTVRLHNNPTHDGVEYATIEADEHNIDVHCVMAETMYSHTFLQCLSHELNHAAMCILGTRGVNFDYENQEALCYLQDYLMKEALDKLERIEGQL